MGFHRRCVILQWGEVRVAGERAVKIFNEQWLLQGRRQGQKKSHRQLHNPLMWLQPWTQNQVCFFHGGHERRRYSILCTPIVSTYHCQFLNISLFMKVGKNHKILFIADIVTNNDFNFGILRITTNLLCFLKNFPFCCQLDFGSIEKNHVNKKK